MGSQFSTTMPKPIQLSSNSGKGIVFLVTSHRLCQWLRGLFQVQNNSLSSHWWTHITGYFDASQIYFSSDSKTSHSLLLPGRRIWKWIHAQKILHTAFRKWNNCRKMQKYFSKNWSPHVQACLRRKLSERVGCRLPWDPSTREFPNCDQLHQFRCAIWLWMWRLYNYIKKTNFHPVFILFIFIFNFYDKSLPLRSSSPSSSLLLGWSSNQRIWGSLLRPWAPEHGRNRGVKQ